MTDARTRRRREKRDSIVAAAAEVFREEGYELASMDRISERAGASKRTVYNHFGSKEALFEAVIAAGLAQMEAQVAIRWDPTRPIADQLAAFAQAKADLAADPEHLGLIRVVLGAFIQHPELATQTALRTTADETALVKWLIAADAAGALRVPHPAIAAEQFWALVKGAVFWPRVFALGEPTPDAVDEAITTFLARYAA